MSSPIWPALGRAASSSSRCTHLPVLNITHRSSSAVVGSGRVGNVSVVLPGRRPFSSSPPSKAGFGLVEGDGRPLAPHLQRQQQNTTAPPVREGTPEEAQIAQLRELHATAGRHPRDNEIPGDLIVQPFLPNEPRPRPPIRYSEMRALPELAPYRATHHLVMIKISVGQSSKPNSYSIVRAQSKAEVAEQEHKEKEKRKEIERNLAAQRLPSALGKNSGLRNQAAPKEIEATWVMSDHDMEHRMNQVRGYLENAFRVTVAFRPKRSGKKLKVSDKQKQEQIEKAWATVSDIAERYEQDKVQAENITL